MLFNSIQYLVFFTIVATVYYLISYRYRWMFLLASSYYFYMCWKIEYALLLAASTISVYAAGILLEKYEQLKIKKWILTVALMFNLGILFVFKYFNFFNDSLRSTLDQFNIFYSAPTLQWLLPVGISFYTFQVISYLIDVFKGEQAAEKHIGYFALFVAFFPKLISGPIERAKNLLPQFYEKNEFDYRTTTNGLKLIAWGLFQKLVIADRLAIYVNQVYDNPGHYEGAAIAVATVFYAFQVYCDFCGYSDIAIGSGQVLGFRLMKNFDRPFHARSVSEFWRRWHISFSSWLNDYLYIPIVINRRGWGKAGIVFSLFVTFVICGLWHGANWTFVVFGLMHGFVLSLEVLTKNRRKKIRRAVPEILYNTVCLILTFSFLCFSFIFFRANSIADAFLLINNMLAIDVANIDISVPQVSRLDFLLSLLSIAILEIVHMIQGKVEIRRFIADRGLLTRWALYIVFVSYILFFRKTGAGFIYFQF